MRTLSTPALGITWGHFFRAGVFVFPPKSNNAWRLRVLRKGIRQGWWTRLWCRLGHQCHVRPQHWGVAIQVSSRGRTTALSTKVHRQLSVGKRPMGSRQRQILYSCWVSVKPSAGIGEACFWTWKLRTGRFVHSAPALDHYRDRISLAGECPSSVLW